MLYLQISIAIGIAQILDSAYLYWNKGRVTKLGMIFSVVECFWAVISFWVVFRADFSGPIPLWLPLMFVIYVAVGFAYGAKNWEKFKVGSSFVFPRKMVIWGSVFGAIFAFASWAVA